MDKFWIYVIILVLWAIKALADAKKKQARRPAPVPQEQPIEEYLPDYEEPIYYEEEVLPEKVKAFIPVLPTPLKPKNQPTLYLIPKEQVSRSQETKQRFLLNIQNPAQAVVLAEIFGPPKSLSRRRSR